MSTTIAIARDFAPQGWTPVLLLEIKFGDGSTLYWSDRAIGANYVPMIVRHDLFEVLFATEDGVDAPAQFSFTVSNADGTVASYAESKTFRGASLTAQFVLCNMSMQPPAVTSDAIAYRFVLNDPEHLNDAEATFTATSKMAWTRAVLPTYRLQFRCPKAFPQTATDRAAGASAPGVAPTLQQLRFSDCGYSPGLVAGNFQSPTTTLYAAVAPGAQTIQTNAAIEPDSQIVIVGATASLTEQFTVTACTGASAPFTCTLGSLVMQSHSAGAMVGAPFTSCDFTPDSCKARGMYSTDVNGTVTNRFGGVTYVPPSTMVESYGQTFKHMSPVEANVSKYNDFLPLVYGTAWVQGVLLFSWNDGNNSFVHIAVAAGGVVQNVSRLIVNGYELTQTVDSSGYNDAHLRDIGFWYIVNDGSRTGAVDSINPKADPYGSICVVSAMIPNKIYGGTGGLDAQVLVEGLKVETFDSNGNSLGYIYSNNNAWHLLDVLKRTGWSVADDIDAVSFYDAAQVCSTLIESSDNNNNTVELPRFQSNFTVQQRSPAARVITSIRNTARLLLTYNATNGKLQCKVKDQAANNGGYAITFDASNVLLDGDGLPLIDLQKQPIADTPNQLTTQFSDVFNQYFQQQFTLDHYDDITNVGQIITKPFYADGLSTRDQAARILSCALNEIVDGNEFVVLETSAKGMGLQPGQLFQVNWPKYGLNAATFRCTKIEPSVDFGNIRVTGQLHRDEWYIDSNGQQYTPGGVTSVFSPVRNQFPYGLIGRNPYTDGNWTAWDYDVTETSSYDNAQLPYVTLAVDFVAPVAVAGTTGKPIVDQSPTYDSSSGPFAGGQDVFAVVTAIDANGNEGAPSMAVRARIPSGTDTNSFAFNAYFDNKAFKYNVYIGKSTRDLALCMGLAGTAIPPAGGKATINVNTDTTTPQTPPNANFAYANVYWRPTGASKWILGASHVTASPAEINVPNINGYAIQIQCRAVDTKGNESPESASQITNYGIGGLSQIGRIIGGTPITSKGAGATFTGSDSNTGGIDVNFSSGSLTAGQLELVRDSIMRHLMTATGHGFNLTPSYVLDAAAGTARLFASSPGWQLADTAGGGRTFTSLSSSGSYVNYDNGSSANRLQINNFGYVGLGGNATAGLDSFVSSGIASHGSGANYAAYDTQAGGVVANFQSGATAGEGNILRAGSVRYHLNVAGHGFETTPSYAMDLAGVTFNVSGNSPYANYTDTTSGGNQYYVGSGAGGIGAGSMSIGQNGVANRLWLTTLGQFGVAGSPMAGADLAIFGGGNLQSSAVQPLAGFTDTSANGKYVRIVNGYANNGASAGTMAIDRDGVSRYYLNAVGHGFEGTPNYPVDIAAGTARMMAGAPGWLFQDTTPTTGLTHLLFSSAGNFTQYDFTNAADRAIIDSAGKFGIATQPSYAMDLVGTAFNISANAPYANYTDTATGGNQYFVGSGTGGIGAGPMGIGQNGVANRLWLATNGYLGIGGTPSDGGVDSYVNNAISVHGPNAFVAPFDTSTNGIESAFQSGSDIAGQTNIWRDGAIRYRLNAAGHGFDGTPSYPVDIVGGTARVMAGGPTLSLQDTTPTTGLKHDLFSSNGSFVQYDASNDAVRTAIDSSGHYGIGGSAGSWNFNVMNGTTMGLSYSSYPQVSINNTSSGRNYGVGSGTSSDPSFFGIADNTGGAWRMNLDSAGRYAWGQATPSSAGFDIYSGAYPAVYTAGDTSFGANDTRAGGASAAMGTGGDNTGIGYLYNRVQGSNGVYTAAFDNANRFGIGAVPSYPLHVVGDGSAALYQVGAGVGHRLDDTNNGGTQAFFTSGAAGSTGYVQVWRSGSSSVLTMPIGSANPSVGINMLPDVELNVNGSAIRAQWANPAVQSLNTSAGGRLYGWASGTGQGASLFGSADWTAGAWRTNMDGNGYLALGDALPTSGGLDIFNGPFSSIHWANNNAFVANDTRSGGLQVSVGSGGTATGIGYVFASGSGSSNPIQFNAVGNIGIAATPTSDWLSIQGVSIIDGSKNLRANAPYSTILNDQGSIPPSLFPAWSYSSSYNSSTTTSSIVLTISAAYNLPRSDGSTVTITTALQSWTWPSVNPGVAFYIYPYWSIARNSVHFAGNGTPSPNAADIDPPTRPLTSQSGYAAMNQGTDGRIPLFIGSLKVTAASSSGGGTSGGGGGGDGLCIEQNEPTVILERGKRPQDAQPVNWTMGQLKVGDYIRGWDFKEQRFSYRKVVRVAVEYCSQWRKPFGRLMTPLESIWTDGGWKFAYKCPGGSTIVQKQSRKVRIHVEAGHPDDHNYFLGRLEDTREDLTLMHNFQPQS